MKRVAVAGVVIAVVLGVLAAPSLADIRLKGGWFMPSEKDPVIFLETEVGTFPIDGLIFGAEMTSSLAGMFDIGVGAEYYQASEKFEATTAVLDTLALSQQVIPITATAYLHPGNRFYVGGGVGYYLVNRTEDEDSENKSGFGYHAVAGFDLTDRIFVEGKYSTCTISDWEVGPSSSDVGGISVMAGISL